MGALKEKKDAKCIKLNDFLLSFDFLYIFAEWISSFAARLN